MPPIDHGLHLSILQPARRKPLTKPNLLKAVSASMKGEITPDMLLVASDSIRRERDFRQSFPGWDYTEEAYKNAGIEDIHIEIDLFKNRWKNFRCSICREKWS